MSFNYSGAVPVQSATSGSGAQNTTDLTLAFPASPTAGNLLIVCLAWYPTDTIAGFTLTDTLGNTYTLIQSVAIGTNQGHVAMYYCANCLGGGANSVTFHSTTSIYKRIAIVELPGLSTTTLDTSNTGTGNSTQPTTGTIIPAAAGEFLVSMCSDVIGATTRSAGTGWETIINFPSNTTSGSGDMPITVGGKVNLDTSAIAAPFYIGAGSLYAAIIASFKNMGPVVASGTTYVFNRTNHLYLPEE